MINRFSNNSIHEGLYANPHISVQKFEESKTECLIYKTILEDIR